jgi:hypothetical protein
MPLIELTLTWLRNPNKYSMNYLKRSLTPGGHGAYAPHGMWPSYLNHATKSPSELATGGGSETVSAAETCPTATVQASDIDQYSRCGYKWGYVPFYSDVQRKGGMLVGVKVACEKASTPGHWVVEKDCVRVAHGDISYNDYKQCVANLQADHCVVFKDTLQEGQCSLYEAEFGLQ